MTITRIFYQPIIFQRFKSFFNPWKIFFQTLTWFSDVQPDDNVTWFFVRFCHDKGWQIKMWPDKSKLQERLWFLSKILNFGLLEIQNFWGWDIHLGTKNPVRFPIRISGQVSRNLRGRSRSKNLWEGLEGSFLSCWNETSDVLKV